MEKLLFIIKTKYVQPLGKRKKKILHKAFSKLGTVSNSEICATHSSPWYRVEFLDDVQLLLKKYT